MWGLTQLPKLCQAFLYNIYHTDYLLTVLQHRHQLQEAVVGEVFSSSIHCRYSMTTDDCWPDTKTCWQVLWESRCCHYKVLRKSRVALSGGSSSTQDLKDECKLEGRGKERGTKTTPRQDHEDGGGRARWTFLPLPRQRLNVKNGICNL